VPSPHIGRIDPPLCLENPLSFFAPNLSPLVPTGGNSPGPTGLGASTPRPSNRCDFRLGCRPASQSPGSRPAGGTREAEAETVWPLHLPPFPSHRAVFGTDRSGQGRAVSARRRRIFCGLEKILRSGPLTARTVLEHGAEGKGGQAAEATTDASSFTAGFLRCLVRLLYPRILL
jgi:hypothetical protein